MQLKFLSVPVLDQDIALMRYVDILGFKKMADLPMGDFRWLTVTSPDGIAGVELVLEPINFPPALVYQKALFDAGIPALALISFDIVTEIHSFKQKSVVFRGEPRQSGPIKSVLFEDGCGNLINLVQVIQ